MGGGGSSLGCDAAAQVLMGPDADPSAVAAKTVEIMLRDKLAERAGVLGEHMKASLAALQQRSSAGSAAEFPSLGGTRGP